ncbi:MAG: immunoglobulin domain-containing protein [Verrucomicrobia subdivision 3 bacterium]|nr:immunoglobulin domain-containing protein [Limisphaerales bacterium]
MKHKANLLMLTALLAAATDISGRPVITQQPTNQMPSIGSNVTFSVTATGAPPLTYQWRFNGTDLPSQTNSSLGLTNVQFINAGPHRVVVSNNDGTVTSDIAWLSVLPTNVVNLGDLELSFGVSTNLSALNSPRYDDAATLTGDGLTIFFCSDRSGGLGGLDIWLATRATVSTPWGVPVNLGASVNTASNEGDPSISSDGLSLYFFSNRTGSAGPADIWVATRPVLSDPFGTPVNLGPAVNSAWEEFTPCISADGLTLLFSALDRPGGLGATDIWISTRTNRSTPWEPARNLGEPVNTVHFQHFQHSPCLSADGLLLFYHDNRTTVGRHGRVWVSKRATTASPFRPPVMIRAIAEVEATFRTRPHAISADGTTLYFASDRSGGLGDWDIWQISVTRLPVLAAPGVNGSGEFQFELLGREGATYEIQSSPDLSTWTTWLTTNATGSVQLRDSALVPGDRRFYRALSH